MTQKGSEFYICMRQMIFNWCKDNDKNSIVDDLIWLAVSEAVVHKGPGCKEGIDAAYKLATELFGGPENKNV